MRRSTTWANDRVAAPADFPGDPGARLTRDGGPRGLLDRQRQVVSVTERQPVGDHFYELWSEGI